MRRLLNRLPHLALLAALLGTGAQAAQLQVELPTGLHTWDSSDLLKHPRSETIRIDADVAYKRSMLYRAIPLAVLLEGIEPGDHLQAVALDGFAAELPAAPLLATQGARAWLAIEDPQQPWPALAAGKPSAGPFYLVWQNPEAAQIGPEQWPFQVARIRLLAPLAQRFPALLPATGADAAVQAGFAQFQKNCLACHRLNGAGDSQFGPDLNIPHNPTEYFSGDFLKQYIRNPQSLRRWPEGRMPAFSPSVISDRQLEQLIDYLRHMSTRKTER